ncbi:MAG: hypothetical protein QGG40_12905, partial [Myxococcota bacterium]|nr:hypothetical protein [Myxococcota bacterium]
MSWFSVVWLLSLPAYSVERAMYERAVDLVEERFLRIEEFSAQQAFIESGEAAEAAIPWLTIDVEGDELVLSHGRDGETGRVRLLP